ncbi:hypothetical protein DTO045G8_7770 [Paecilomyces variotii]|nr:hypothetical protein DTO045G8_7770 [Paecilomyces variotii]
MSRIIDKSELVDSNRLVPDDLINIYRVDEKTVVKLCEPFRLSEAEALRYVHSKTSIPVPKVFNAYVDESLNRGVIVMEYVEGEVLRDVWDDMDDERRKKIVQQLKGFIAGLRSIKGRLIESFHDITCEDPVFRAELGWFGPYKTEDEFNDGLI